MAITTQAKIFDTLQIIYSDNALTPVVGPDSPEKGDFYAAWKWDERHWPNDQIENYYKTLPVLKDQDFRGVPSEFWQSGIGHEAIDLEILETLLANEDEERWTVKIRKGEYFRYREKKFLFPELSYIQYIDNTENVSSRNVLELDEIPNLASPIAVSIWKRDEFGQPSLFRSFLKRQYFSGLYDADYALLDTEDDDGNITWANVNTTKNEFVLKWTDGTDDPPTLYFNKDNTFLVGPSAITDDNSLSFCDEIGSVTDNAQILFTTYFPILDNAEFALYSYNSIAGNTLLTETTDYTVDYDRGEITFYTGSGITIGDTIYAKYRVTMEVEYEPENSNDYIVAKEINLNPLASSVTRGFIYLSEDDLRAASILLSSDLDVISESDFVYGPLSINGAYTTLTATVTSQNSIPVPGVEVTFAFVDNLDGNAGYLNGSLSTAVALTNENGEASVTYTSPRSIEALSQYVEHPNTDTQDELVLPYLTSLTTNDLEDIYIYKVYDDDGWAPWDDTDKAGDAETGVNEPGTGGRKVILYRWADNSTNSITEDGIYDVVHPITGDPGAIMPIHPTSITDGYILGFDDNIEYTETAGTNNTNLVAYFVVGSRRVQIIASCYSYLFNSTIYSNTLQVDLELPETHRGIKIIEASSEKIPYGFRIISDSEDAATGLDGSTFFTINKKDNLGIKFTV